MADWTYQTSDPLTNKIWAKQMMVQFAQWSFYLRISSKEDTSAVMVMDQLEKDLTRISVVAAGAALVLIAFAFAWSTTMRRLSAVQRQAEGERRLVALGRASSVLAHEIRNPIAALKGHAQLLVEDLAEPS